MTDEEIPKTTHACQSDEHQWCASNGCACTCHAHKASELPDEDHPGWEKLAKVVLGEDG